MEHKLIVEKLELAKRGTKNPDLGDLLGAAVELIKLLAGRGEEKPKGAVWVFGYSVGSNHYRIDSLGRVWRHDLTKHKWVQDGDVPE